MMMYNHIYGNISPYLSTKDSYNLNNISADLYNKVSVISPPEEKLKKFRKHNFLNIQYI